MAYFSARPSISRPPKRLRPSMRSPVKTLIFDLNAMLEDMLSAANADDELQLAAIDRDFHRRILKSANLPALDRILHRCLVHNHRFTISRSRTGRDLRATALRHRSIIDAIESGDVAQAPSPRR